MMKGFPAIRAKYRANDAWHFKLEMLVVSISFLIAVAVILGGK